MFASSSGASTSSSRQNGVGRIRKSENTSAVAVSAFSPPESRLSDWSFFPDSCTTISTPASAPSSPGNQLETGDAAGEHLREDLGELRVRRLERLVEALTRRAA
jgi:hypothetical protein